MMAHYAESAITEIKNKLSIADVVSNYVTLTRRGDRLWGLCPFHTEKTPSFSVSPDRGFFKCFGCGKGGSMFDFVMEMEHVDFSESVRILAKRAGVELKQETEAEKARRSFEESLQELYAKLANAFNYILLNSAQAAKAREYLQRRKVSADSIRRFCLGYAPSDPKWLYGFLTKGHYSAEFLARSGLFSARNAQWPLFADRLMFPIRTWQGRFVAFSGRDLSGNSRAKYINTPETELYKKGNMLFGMFEGLDAIKKTGSFVLCEGNFDVVSLQQSGVSNAVAPLGTAFTADQVALLHRYCSKGSLLLDSDGAGQSAAQKALVLCQQNGVESSVISLNGVKDPSELLEKEGEQALSEACANPSNGFDYLVQLALKRYDIRQPKAKYLIFKEVKPFLDATDSEIERQGYVRKLADRIGVSEQQILEDYRREHSGDTVKRPESDAGEEKTITIDTDLSLMLMLAKQRDLFSKYKSSLSIGLLDNGYARSIYAVLEDARRLGYTSDEVLLQMIADPDLRKLVTRAFASELYDSENVERDVGELIRKIRLKDLRRRRSDVLGVLKISQGGGTDQEGEKELLGRIQELDRQIEDLKNGSSEQ